MTMSLMTLKEKLALAHMSRENVGLETESVVERSGKGGNDEVAVEGRLIKGDTFMGGAVAGSARPSQVSLFGGIGTKSERFGEKSATAEELRKEAKRKMKRSLDPSKRLRDLKPRQADPRSWASINGPHQNLGPSTNGR